MLRKLLAITAALVFVASVNANITASWAAVAGQSYVYDILVTITDTPGVGADDWSAAGLTATVNNGATFINADNYNPPFITPSYDSFFTSPQWYPNTTAVGFVSFAPGSPVENSTYRFGEWYDVADTGNGTFTINRLAVNPAEGAVLDISLLVAAVNTAGQLFPFSWTIPVPEPASLSLLGLGALALIRRR